MTSERRYTEDEVDKILDRATKAASARGPGASDSTGLTLPELQEIGKEVGIPEEVITEAATSLDRPESKRPATQTFLGQTIGVGRTVDLPRPLTDKEWSLLVMDLRDTFDANGRISDQGPFRQWRNGNLQALLEPTETGQRLRLRTVQGNARSFQGTGAAFTISGVGMGIALLSAGADPSIFPLLGVIGAGLFLVSRLTVPLWARERSQQFEDIIARLINRIGPAVIESGDSPPT